MPTLQQKRLLFEGGGVTWVFRDDFITDRAAGAVNNTPAEPGIGTRLAVDAANVLTISGHRLRIAPGNAETREYVQLNRAAGRVAIIKGQYTVAPQRVGWGSLQSSDSQKHGSFFLNGTSTGVYYGTGALIQSLCDTVTGVDYQFAVLLQSAGSYWFIKGGTFTQWTLIFVDFAGVATPLFVGVNSHLIAAAGNYEYVYVRDLPYPFNTPFGLALHNVAAPSGAYVGLADQIIDVDITAPGVLANEGGFRYRVQDANNYWRAYFSNSGQLRINSISGGVATNRLSAAGIIAGGQTRKLRIIVSGTIHKAIVFDGSIWTKIGSDVNFSHVDTATGIETDFGVGWSGVDLRVFKRGSPEYNELDKGIAA